MPGKAESAMIRARIAPKLKEEVEAILAEVGLSASDAIRMYYRQIKMHKGIPFDVKVPNTVTLEAMHDAETGSNLIRFESAEDALASLGLYMAFLLVFHIQTMKPKVGFTKTYTAPANQSYLAARLPICEICSTDKQK